MRRVRQSQQSSYPPSNILEHCLRLIDKNDHQGLITGNQKNRQSKSMKKDRTLSKDEDQQLISKLQQLRTQQKLSSPESLDEIRQILPYYLFFEDFLHDLVSLFKNKETDQTFQYLDKLLTVSCRKMILRFQPQFEECIFTSIQQILQDMPDQIKKVFIPRSEEEFRHYIHIDQYTSDEPKSLKYMKSSLKPKDCPINCDCQLLTSINYSEITEFTSCYNMRYKINCARNCRNQDGEPCKNQRKQAVEHSNLQEAVVWGIDYYTRRNILFFLVGQNESMKLKFLEETLQNAFNQLGLKGYDLNNALDYILNHENFTHYDKIQAQQLKRALKFDTNNNAFKVSCKGKGVICKSYNGIKKGTLIEKYLGEVFTIPSWFEKQDLIKDLIYQNKQKGQPINEFFNIQLERSKLESDKTEKLLIIDPTNKGNFTSRLSHSCHPNCQAETMIDENGNYYIGMFTLRDIKNGEELTFDYGSTTTNANDVKEAICLCGTLEFQHHYVKYLNWKSVLKQWEIKNIKILMEVCDKQDGPKDWIKKWKRKVLSLREGKDLTIEGIIKDSVSLTSKRIKHYFNLQKKQLDEIYNTLPFSLMSPEESCQLFLRDLGELDFIIRYLIQSGNCKYLPTINTYRKVLNLAFEKKKHDIVLKEISILLQYLSACLKGKDETLSEMMYVRSQITQILKFNVNPIILGNTFIRNDFENYKGHIDYNTLPEKVTYYYPQDFIWQVTNDLTQDSRINFKKHIYTKYFVFNEHSNSLVNQVMQEHQQSLMLYRIFYSKNLEEIKLVQDYESEEQLQNFINKHIELLSENNLSLHQNLPILRKKTVLEFKTQPSQDREDTKDLISKIQDPIQTLNLTVKQNISKSSEKQINHETQIIPQPTHTQAIITINEKQNVLNLESTQNNETEIKQKINKFIQQKNLPQLNETDLLQSLDISHIRHFQLKYMKIQVIQSQHLDQGDELTTISQTAYQFTPEQRKESNVGYQNWLNYHLHIDPIKDYNYLEWIKKIRVVQDRLGYRDFRYQNQKGFRVEYQGNFKVKQEFQE